MGPVVVECPVRFSELVDASHQIASTKKRLAKIATIAACVRSMSDAERSLGVAYLSGALPQGKLGVGYATLRALRSAHGGEDGGITLSSLDELLAALKLESGTGSAKRKVAALEALFAQLGEREAAFLSRLLLGEVRQGALESLVTDAVASAADVPAESLRRALMFAGSLPRVTEVAFAEGDAGLKRFGLELFRPVKPMLANTAKDAEEALAPACPALAEVKMDGARIQVHRQGARVRVYSRNLREVTYAVPEVVEVALKLPGDAFVLEGEVIALGRDGRPLPFQTTMRRFGRKQNVEQLRERLPLTPFFFDVLYLDGTTWMDASLTERVSQLHALVPEAWRVEAKEVSQAADLDAFYDCTVAAGHEGIMIKDPKEPYQAGKRGNGWLKLKPVHTLDLVILAAEWGSGRRQGWLSNLHLGARDGDGFAHIGKTFKGLSDEMLQFQTERLLSLETHRSDYVVHVRPELLVEIAFSDVQQSPHYASGCALRFARVKSYRRDKAPTEADTIETVRGLVPPVPPG